jgi:RAD50-interacting protein 1
LAEDPSVLCLLWLARLAEIWAEIERQDTFDKLKSAMELEKNWSTRIQGAMLEYELDDYKSQTITFAVQQGLSLLIDRARPIPSITLRAEFIRMSVSPIISEFLGYMLRRSQEAEGLTALADDSALLKVSQSINVARHFESILTVWCQDVSFLEMENLPGVDGGGGCIFQQEINHLKEFRVEWVDKIYTVILRAFDSCSRGCLKNKRQWLDKSDGPAVSRAFIEYVDYMQGRLSKLGVLNALDFVMVWRSVTSGVDQLLFAGIFTGGTKISNSAVERFQGDVSIFVCCIFSVVSETRGLLPETVRGVEVVKDR